MQGRSGRRASPRRRSAARRPASGSGSARRRRPDAASTSRTISRWVSVSGPGELVARGAPSGARSSAASTAVGGVLGPDRLRAGDPAADQRHRGQVAEPLDPAQVAVAGRVDQRVGERRRRDVGLADRRGGQRLRALHPHRVVRRRAERRDPDEVPRADALGGPQQAPRGEPVELLDRRPRLIAGAAGEVHDGVHAPQRVAPRGRIGQVPDRQLDPHPLRPKPPRVTNQTTHRRAACDQPSHHGVAQQSRCSGHQKHCRSPAYATIPAMAYVIAEPCIGTKDNSCVEVCPVDCIHPTPDEPDYDTVKQLYIDPDECIDCDACVEACPVDACFAEDQLPDEWGNFASSTPTTSLGSSRRAGRVSSRPSGATSRRAAAARPGRPPGPAAATGAAGVIAIMPARRVADRLGGRIVGIDRHERDAGVGVRAQRHRQRDLAEQRDLELVGQALAAALAEDREALAVRRGEAGHVLDDRRRSRG